MDGYVVELLVELVGVDVVEALVVELREENLDSLDDLSVAVDQLGRR